MYLLTAWEWHRHVEVKEQLWRVNFLLVHVAPQDQSQVVRLSDKPLTNLPPPSTVTGFNFNSSGVYKILNWMWWLTSNQDPGSRGRRVAASSNYAYTT